MGYHHGPLPARLLLPFASDFRSQRSGATWRLKQLRDLSESGNNRRGNRRDLRDFGAIR